MSTYRLDRPAAAVTAGALLIAAAVTAFSAFLVPSRVLAAITVVLVVAAAAVLVRPPVVARLDEDGIRSRRQRLRWVDVEEVDVADGVCTLRSADGGAVVVALGPVGRRRRELLREVYDRLNTAHGYRRFDPTV